MNTYKMFFFLFIDDFQYHRTQTKSRSIVLHRGSSYFENPKTCDENSQIECEENSLIADS